MIESTLSISKGYLEEVDFGEAIWMALESLPWDRRWGKEGISPLLRTRIWNPWSRDWESGILILMPQIINGKDIIMYCEVLQRQMVLLNIRFRFMAFLWLVVVFRYYLPTPFTFLEIQLFCFGSPVKPTKKKKDVYNPWLS